MTIRWVVFDLGETLVDETRPDFLWADRLGVSHLPCAAVLGAGMLAVHHALSPARVEVMLSSLASETSRAS